MNNKKMERKPPMTFVNRGGKGASDIAVGYEDPNHGPMEDRSSSTAQTEPHAQEEPDGTKSSSRRANVVLDKKSPSIRSSRV